MSVRFPAGPLIARVERAATASGSSVLGICGGHSRSYKIYQRARITGRLTVTGADWLAVTVLGVHPSDVWPDWYEVAA